MLPDSPVKVLVVGSGGREHALCWKLAKSAMVSHVYCAPGNGGTESESKVSNLTVGVDEFEKLAEFCRSESVGLVVVGPDNPLADGIVDHLRAGGIRVFGPTREEARVEWSKAHAKTILQELKIPTARFLVAGSLEEGLAAVRKNDWARVVKVDGLALGKGVFVCTDLKEAELSVREVFDKERFGAAGQKVVVEEKLSGEEISLLTLCDGKTIVPLLPSQDYKRRFDDDKGPNTGGMGAYAPVPVYEKFRDAIEKSVLDPLKGALQAGKFNYRGVLYIGLMIAEDSRGQVIPHVLEFNARFGDPETQAILPLMESDLFEVLWAVTEARLQDVEMKWSNEHCCCVIAAADTYPGASSKGEAIEIEESASGTTIFHAGTKVVDGQLVTNGGRILAVSATAETIEQAHRAAYRGMYSVTFKGKAFRKDIARRAMVTCP